MNGITVDTFEAFESLTEITDFGGFALQTEAEIFNSAAFIRKYSTINCRSLIIRNPVPARLNRLILDSSFKLQTDYLESLEKELEKYSKVDVDKILLDFDLPTVIANEEKYPAFTQILSAIKGMTYAKNIGFELLFRLPFNGMEDFAAIAAFFRQQSMTNLNYALDLHIHEAHLDSGELAELLLPVQYDIGTINFVYDAALGNRINLHNLKKITDLMSAKCLHCQYFLCPSGNVNLQSIHEDISEWMKI